MKISLYCLLCWQQQKKKKKNGMVCKYIYFLKSLTEGHLAMVLKFKQNKKEDGKESTLLLLFQFSAPITTLKYFKVKILIFI